MSDSTSGLLQAIEGFSAANAGNKTHQQNIELLRKVAGELQRNKASETSNSPGQREARAAAQVNMAAEEGHSGGGGNKTTNAPGSARHGEPAADVQENSKGTASIGGTGPEASAGSVRSILPGPAARSGVVEIRRGAAIKALESEKSSGGNAHSNTPGKAAANEKRIGDVAAPSKAPADRNTNATSFEKAPAEVGKERSGDGWGRAAEKARKLARSL